MTGYPNWVASHLLSSPTHTTIFLHYRIIKGNWIRRFDHTNVLQTFLDLIQFCFYSFFFNVILRPTETYERTWTERDPEVIWKQNNFQITSDHSRSLERTKSHVIHTWSVDHLKNVLFLTDRGSHADHTLITCDQLYTNLSPSSSDPGVIFRITCDSHQPGSRLDHSRSRRVPYPLYNWITCDLLDHSWITCTSHVIRRITSIHGWNTSDHFRITRDVLITCGPDVFQVIRKSYVFRLITREHLRITFGFRDVENIFKTVCQTFIIMNLHSLHKIIRLNLCTPVRCHIKV